MSKATWDIPKEEMEAIENIFERKTALENLTKLPDVINNEALYEKLITDYGKTVIAFQKWWDNGAEKYGWQGNMHVDFEHSQVVEE